jgi:hypothetical protein
MYRRWSREENEWKTNEWWWEREWRHVGDFYFFVHRVAFYICPEADMPEIQDVIEATRPNRGQPPPPCVDPSWGLDRIFAHLLGIDRDDINPFTQRAQ